MMHICQKWASEVTKMILVHHFCLSFKLNKAQKTKPWKNTENIFKNHVQIK